MWGGGGGRCRVSGLHFRALGLSVQEAAPKDHALKRSGV